MTPVRKEGEAQLIPGATAPPSTAPAERPVYVYLSDSTETNRVRTPLRVGAEIEVRGLFATRELMRDEETAFRNIEDLPDGVAASPAVVECVVMTPGQRHKMTPAVSQRDGVYVASVVVGRRGGWFYHFVGKGIFSGSNSRAFDIR